MVRARCLPSLLPIARLMHRTINVLRWGEHRGGMFVEIKAGSVVRSWHMVAEGDDGPLIPSMACEAIVRRCLEGKQPASGARAATGELELDDYDKLFARRAIHTGIREATPETASLPRMPCPATCCGNGAAPTARRAGRRAAPSAAAARP